jgi:hypothetical protein
VTDHTKINEGQPKRSLPRPADRILGLDEQVARMWIGVEKAFFENLLEIGVQNPNGYFLSINSGGGHSVNIRDFDAADIFEDENALG